MSRDDLPDGARLSRRGFLRTAAVGGGALLGLSFAAPANAAKMKQAAVRYQGTPKNNQKCSSCALFQAPNGCKTVQGPVSSNGWCILYAKKS